MRGEGLHRRGRGFTGGASQEGEGLHSTPAAEGRQTQRTHGNVE